MSIDIADAMEKLIAAAAEAAKIVMRIYAESDPDVELKGPDDPVTRADKEANTLLLKLLSRDFPGIPLVAEESDPSTYEGFGSAPVAIFVDPVDGTREFIAKNGEFAVMLGLAVNGKAAIGVIDCCALGEVYAGGPSIGAFCIKDGVRTRIHVSNTSDVTKASCAVSRSNRTSNVESQLEKLELGSRVPTGGAGIKAIRVANGSVDLYAHPSGNAVKLWDACAPDAIVVGAGGIYTDARGHAFDYRGPYAQLKGTVAANPVLHAEALKRLKA